MLRGKPSSPITYPLCPLPAWLEQCAAEEVKFLCGVTEVVWLALWISHTSIDEARYGVLLIRAGAAQLEKGSAHFTFYASYRE